MKPGRELDALITEKVMGYTKENPPKGCLCSMREWCETCLWHSGQHMPYSTDIAAAWHVVEKMAQIGVWLEITSIIGRTLEGYELQDYMVRYRPSLPGNAPKVFGDSAAHAICLAALKAISTKV